MTVLQKVPFLNRLLYAMGNAGYNMLERVLTTWLMFYYVAPPESGRNVLVGAFIFGGVMFFGRVVDAVADPLISVWTDNASFKKGRRWPFMLWGGLPLAVVSIALFYPPKANESILNAVYLALMVGLFFFFFTFYVCPYLALIPELARNDRERVDLTTLQAVFMLLGTGGAMVGSGILIEKFNFHTMVWIMAIISVFLLYLPVVAINEKKYCRGEPAGLGLVDSLKQTFKNRPFRIYLAGNCFYWFGFNIITIGVPYYVTVLVGAGEGSMTAFLAITFGVSALLFPIINIAAKAFGKKKIMLFSMGCFAILLPFIYFFNNPILPMSPYNFGLLIMGLLGIPLSCLFVVPNAIVADITDYDEIITGTRRESMFFGAQGFLLKFVMALSSLSMGLLFQLFGNSLAEPLGVQLTGPFAAIFILVGFIVFLRYPEEELGENAR